MNTDIETIRVGLITTLTIHILRTIQIGHYKVPFLTLTKVKSIIIWVSSRLDPGKTSFIMHSKAIQCVFILHVKQTQKLILLCVVHRYVLTPMWTYFHKKKDLHCLLSMNSKKKKATSKECHYNVKTEKHGLAYLKRDKVKKFKIL